MARAGPLIEISRGAVYGVVAAHAGGLVLSARKDGRDLLRPAPGLEAARSDPRLAACFPCVPYFGRLYGGLFFEGRKWEQKPTLPGCDPRHATHGEGWVSEWSPATRTTDSATVRFHHGGRAAGRFPFPFDAEQRVTLTELNLIAIVWGAYGYTAMVQTPEGHGYSVRRGTKIGQNNGVVSAITERGIIVQERFTDVYGKKQEREYVKLLHPKEGSE